jgi:hypothetical protein
VVEVKGCCNCVWIFITFVLLRLTGVQRESHVNSKRVREWHGEQVVQGARVKQSDHALTTPTNDVRLTERQTPPGPCLNVDKLLQRPVMIKLAQYPSPGQDVGVGGDGATPTFYRHETVVL